VFTSISPIPRLHRNRPHHFDTPFGQSVRRPIVTINRRVRLPLREAPLWGRLLFLADGMMVSQIYD